MDEEEESKEERQPSLPCDASEERTEIIISPIKRSLPVSLDKLRAVKVRDSMRRIDSGASTPSFCGSVSSSGENEAFAPLFHQKYRRLSIDEDEKLPSTLMRINQSPQKIWQWNRLNLLKLILLLVVLCYDRHSLSQYVSTSLSHIRNAYSYYSNIRTRAYRRHKSDLTPDLRRLKPVDKEAPLERKVHSKAMGITSLRQILVSKLSQVIGSCQYFVSDSTQSLTSLLTKVMDTISPNYEAARRRVNLKLNQLREELKKEPTLKDRIIWYALLPVAVFGLVALFATA